MSAAIEEAPTLIVKQRGLCDYEPIWHQMQDFNAARTENTTDELWIVQHPPVFTLGLNGKTEHILNAGDIPVIAVDRGGQVTYHGPGQIVIYPLLDIRRKKVGIRELVSILEDSVIELLAQHSITASSRKDAPGVYVNKAKIAALGLRIKRGGSYHGLSLNVDMDLEPFTRINPCGYEDMTVTQCKDHGIMEDSNTLSLALVTIFADKLGYQRQIT